jgi:hypothetical protein
LPLVHITAAAPPCRRPRRPAANDLFALASLFLFTACSGSGYDGSGSWVGERLTEDGVTTVRTLSGAIWQGTARLVEEAALGGDTTDEAQLLGSVTGLYAYAGRIYVLDQQIPAVRVYDADGSHLMDLGREGDGPGEFRRPTSLAVHPEDGRIFVRDGSGGRINIYAPDGSVAGRWPMRSGFSTSEPLMFTDDGALWTQTILNWGSDVTEWDMGMVRCGPEGAPADTIRRPKLGFDAGYWTIVGRTENNTTVNGVPFAPGDDYHLMPDGAMVAGASDRYRFGIYRRDGRVLMVEKTSWDPVRVEPAERDWYERAATFNMQNQFEGWAWNGPDIPDHKPAFSLLMPDRSGRVWVARPGPGEHIEGCDETFFAGRAWLRDPCWRDSLVLEVFETDGRYLGGVEVPAGLRLRPRPYIDGDTVVAYLEDEAGTPWVKRFRLVPPGADDDRGSGP